MNTFRPQSSILWPQVLGLTALQGAISLMWVVYGLYLPQLLEQVGMPSQAALTLVVVENGIAIALEPIMGGLSDRAYRWMGSWFPFITVGVIASSALFIAIPLLAIAGNFSDVMRWVVLFVLVAWSLAMTIFHSPTLSLLRRYASIEGIPIANSLLTLMSSLISAPKPMVNQWILGFGPVITFTVGSLVLLGSAALLRSIDASGGSTSSMSSKSSWPRWFWLTLMLIPILGLSIGWGIRMEMATVSKAFQAYLPAVSLDGVMMAIAIGIAIIAIPAGFLATVWGTRRTLYLGLALAVVASGLIVALPISAVLYGGAVLLAIALSLISNGAYPMVLSLVPAARSGLGMGLYLGGVAASTCLFGAFFWRLEGQPLLVSMAIGGAAFLLTGVCVRVAPKSPGI